MVLTAAITLMSLTTPLTPAQWKEPLPGVWTAEVGAHDRPTLTEAAASQPKKDRIALLPQGDLPFDLQDTRVLKSRDFSAIQIPLQPGEKIYGLGMQMEGLDRPGGVYHLRVDHFSDGHDRLHAPTPLYISSLGYAVFFDTSRPINVYAGVGNRLDDPNRPQFRDRNTDLKWDSQPDSGHVEASVEGPGLRTYIFAGPTAMDALRRYNLFCGGGAMPPAWALGFWHRTPLKASAQQVVDEVEEFRKRDFPLDVLGLEPGWQSTSYPGTMQWSAERFPDPKGFVDRLKQEGVHVNLWQNPYVAPGSKLFKELGDHFASHTVWLGAVPDIYSKEASRAMQSFLEKEHVAIGVSGYKIDEVDGYDQWLWPDHATFPSGLDGLQMRQIYGVLWQRLLLEMFEKEGRRTFGLVRASNGAASRFPFAIYSDSYDFDQYVTALTNSSLAGVLWCAEVRSAGTDEEWVRRMQIACMSPIAQLNAWDSGKKPWSYPAVESIVRDTMKLRESLLPYLYTTFAQYALDGVPPVRPMCLVDGGSETDQYMLGDDLLFAPMEPGKPSRTVRFPAGKWFDYQTGVLVSSGAAATISPAPNQIPLFVRAGAAIPTVEPGAHVDLTGPILLRCYGGGPCTAHLYDDDGVDYEFEKGDFGRFRIDVVDQTATTMHEEGKRSSLKRELKVLRVS